MEDMDMGRPSREQIAARQAAAEQASAAPGDDIEARVQARVAEMMPALEKALMESIASKLAAARAEAAGPGGGGGAVVSEADRALMSELVAGIARMADPNNTKQSISPEEARKREAGKAHMIDLIVQAHANGVMPVYRLTRKVYLSEIKIEPQYQDKVTKEMKTQLVNWPNIPSTAMEPENDVARQIHAAFLEWLGGRPNIQGTPTVHFVLSGNEVRHAKPEAPPQTGLRPDDPRNMGGMSANVPTFVNPMQKEQVIRVLGTIADPARMTG